MRLDFVSDLVCPWCFIGLTRLEQALSKAGISTDVVELHPFQLDPATPLEGADLRERLRAKYGANPETMFATVVAAARETGIPLDFSKVRRIPNTLKAHALVAAAKPLGLSFALTKALFAAYFLEGLDIGVDDVLVAVATGLGVPRDTATAVLVDDAALSETRRLARDLAEQGISSVPFVVIEDKIAVSGAQSTDVFSRAIERARGLTMHETDVPRDGHSVEGV